MNERSQRFQDLPAERAVLSAVLLDNSVLANVLEIVVPSEFASPAHAQIFAAMTIIDARSGQVDHVTLAEELKIQGHLAAVGGLEYLFKLGETVSFSQNAVEYARIVKDHSIRRALAKAGREIGELASQETGEVAQLLDDAEKKIFAIAEQRRTGDLRPMVEIMGETIALIEKLASNTSGITGISTGLIDLDRKLTGLHKGELIILAARPGVGKTALAMNIALHVAAEEKLPVGIFSLEMPSTILVTRLLGAHANINMSQVRGGRLNHSDHQKLFESQQIMSQLPLYIDDSGALSAFELRAKARRLKQREPNLGLLIVDYLQLMHQKGKVESRQLEVAEISRALKQLSKELEIPVFALSQLNRRVDERKVGHPQLSDLRESGAIEQDADVVLFIHRKEPEPQNGPPPNFRDPIACELVVAKQRNGPVGAIDVIFFPEFTKFESAAQTQ